MFLRLIDFGLSQCLSVATGRNAPDPVLALFNIQAVDIMGFRWGYTRLLSVGHLPTIPPIGLSDRGGGYSFFGIKKIRVRGINVRFSGFSRIPKNAHNVRFPGFENFDIFDSQTA